MLRASLPLFAAVFAVLLLVLIITSLALLLLLLLEIEAFEDAAPVETGCGVSTFILYKNKHTDKFCLFQNKVTEKTFKITKKWKKYLLHKAPTQNNSGYDS